MTLNTHIQTEIEEKQNHRDYLLDLAKGIGIILVVVGHSLQYQFYPEKFDESLLFRLIYSFHMPFFIVLSGAALSYSISRIGSLGTPTQAILGFSHRIGLSIQRLLLPFVSWTLIKYYLWDMKEGPLNYLAKVFHFPDHSLWFLLCLFNLIVFYYIAKLIFEIGIFYLKKIISLENISKHAEPIFIFIAWLSIQNHLPQWGGLGYIKMYFLYFLIGLVIYPKLRWNPKSWLKFAALIGFLMLAGFWQRQSPNNIGPLLAPYVSEQKLLSMIFAPLTAVIGSLAVYELCRVIYEKHIHFVNISLAYIGKLSLGIYAIHIYFINSEPYVITPLLASALISYLILQIPIARVFLLGETKKKINNSAA